MQTNRTDIDEVKLLTDFKEGDRKAYQIIFARFYRPLCLFTYKMGLEYETVEEIVQDVFLKLWDKRADFDYLYAIQSFLFISCKNGALNSIDRAKRLQKKLDVFSSEQDWIDLPITQQIIYAETVKTIHEAIQRLPPQCRHVMQLLFIEGLPPHEVAQQLSITTSTVYNQKRRGISLLKNVLNPEQLFLLLLILNERNFF
ncbi:MAG TPA: sigma-70 family RNA polymerase sigma factor [Sphingobacterium sp.]|nr:sigma-70 family RNA polymerase sigma factor [Sphingobacterium sp.]